MAQLFEHYNEGEEIGSSVYGVNWKAQTFTPQATHKITSVKLLLSRKSGGNPGTIMVSIRATDEDGKPTGDDLCSGTTNGNTLPEYTEKEWREINFSSSVQLMANIKYAIVVRAPNSDGDNRLFWWIDYSSPTYEGGSYAQSSDSGVSWALDAGYDCMFEEWGNPVKTVSDSSQGAETIKVKSQIGLSDSGQGTEVPEKIEPYQKTVQDENLPSVSHF